MIPLKYSLIFIFLLLGVFILSELYFYYLEKKIINGLKAINKKNNIEKKIEKEILLLKRLENLLNENIKQISKFINNH